MATPTSMVDLSTTAASNSPAGSESPTAGDDFLRAIQAILRTTNAKGADIASATTTDIGAATGEFVDVTGTTTITGLGTIAAGIVRTVRFTGALILTHNATSLQLPGSANITTANGDVAQFRSLGSGNWKCVGYVKANGQIISSLQLLNAGADIASAATVDLTAATGNTVSITGTTTVTAFTMSTGQQMVLIAASALPLTYHATTMNINGGASYTCAAGDRLYVAKDLAGVIRVNVIKQDGKALVDTNDKIQPITASVGSNALTITLNPTSLDFRDATLTSGTVNTRTVAAAISVVVSSGSTLGTTNAVENRLAVLAIDNAGTVELAVVNTSGSVNLNETGVISTTAEGGAGAADSASVIYSTTARTNVAYRVVGFVESTQATAGTWATAPSTIQGIGGQSGISTALNASGSAPMYACRAWVNFNGTGTVAIRASGNVSSITDNGVGDYTINFTTAMPYANYSVSAMTTSFTVGNTTRAVVIRGTDAGGGNLKSTTQVAIQTGTTTAAGLVDMAEINLQVFR